MLLPMRRGCTGRLKNSWRTSIRAWLFCVISLMVDPLCPITNPTCIRGTSILQKDNKSARRVRDAVQLISKFVEHPNKEHSVPNKANAPGVIAKRQLESRRTHDWVVIPDVTTATIVVLRCWATTTSSPVATVSAGLTFIRTRAGPTSRTTTSGPSFASVWRRLVQHRLNEKKLIEKVTYNTVEVIK